MQNDLNDGYHEGFHPQDPINDKDKFKRLDNDKKALNLMVKKLNFLCHEFDPFDALNTNNEIDNIIDEFHLREYLGNPFEFTRHLLKLLDDVEQKIKEKQ